MAGVWQYGHAPRSPVTSIHLLSVWKLDLDQKATRERGLINTNSGLHNLLWEMEGGKPSKQNMSRSLSVLPRRKIKIYYENTTTITKLVETMHRSPINYKYCFYFQSSFDPRQGITRECSQRRKCKQGNLKTVRDKRMITYTGYNRSWHGSLSETSPGNLRKQERQEHS